MRYIDFLRECAKENESIVCVGLDPVVDRIPISGSPEKAITEFYSVMLDAFKSEALLPGAVKPNYAYYAQYGFQGLRALKKVIEKAKHYNIPVILDAKRGDIGKSSAAYAVECFEFWEADAVTISPYMGTDSVMPFVEWCGEKGKGVYVLNRTSNAGAKDLQDLQDADGNKIYDKVSGLIVEWGANARGTVGAVVGATSLDELGEIAKFYALRGSPVPFLIPGVGSQGGSAQEAVNALKNARQELAIHRINSSSGINYAYEKDDSDFAEAAVRALKQLNEEIGEIE